jgi:S-adenosylmethionine synthetase
MEELQMNQKRFFTSESVTEGHPDKMCDQISDAILDEIIAKDPNARVACETVVCTGTVFVMGQISTNCYVDISKVVRRTVADIGYTRAKYGFDSETCAVLTSIDEQSSDIAQGVNSAEEYKTNDDELNRVGAGDQGMMIGYACDETPELMPMAIVLAHKIAKKLADVRKEKLVDYLRPDGKCQVTVEYDGDEVKRVDTIVLSTQHSGDCNMQQLAQDMINLVIRPSVPLQLLD